MIIGIFVLTFVANCGKLFEKQLMYISGEKSMHLPNTLEKKVFSYIKQNHMLMPGDAVVAGISGGADSVCLLLMLVEWKKQYPLKLRVVHVNHGIRKEAAADAGYVEELCRRFMIPFTLVEKDVHQLATEQKCSEEEMGRKVRYEAFGQEALRFGQCSFSRTQSGEIQCKNVPVKIAVAHNSNDQAETVLFHLFRGSGLSGLSGMRPMREQIIRPLLCLEREEIEDYLTQRGVAWCHDVTNEEDAYTRNRIRHHILPYAEQKVAQGSIAHIARAAAMLQETEDFLEQLTQEAYERLVVDHHIFCKAFLRLHKVIRDRLILKLLNELSPQSKDIAYVHVQSVAELFEREGNRQICLPYGIRVRRQYTEVVFERVEQPGDGGTDEMSEAAASGRVLFDQARCVTIDPGELLQKEVSVALNNEENLHFTVFSAEKCKDIPQNQYTKWFDYDKIRKCLTVRTRQTGDYLTIRGTGEGMEHHKSVKDYMVTCKIPRQEREKIPVIAQDAHVVWLVGCRISEYYKVSKNTKRILQVQLIRRNCKSSEMEENNG